MLLVFFLPYSEQKPLPSHMACRASLSATAPDRDAPPSTSTPVWPGLAFHIHAAQEKHNSMPHSNIILLISLLWKCLAKNNPRCTYISDRGKYLFVPWKGCNLFGTLRIKGCMWSRGQRVLFTETWAHPHICPNLVQTHKYKHDASQLIIGRLHHCSLT